MKAYIRHLAGVLLAALALPGCNPDPGHTDQTPLYRSPGDEGPTSGERGSVMISEINWAGSVTNDEVHHWDDVFIELRNQSERTVDLTDWRIRIQGDEAATHAIPETEPLEANEYFVIARKEDGAFGEVADVFIEDLELGRHFTEIELVDADERLMAVAGSTSQHHFAGAWDTSATRSMERVQLIFANSGTASRSWHSYSDDEGLETIAEGYRENTLASPGDANSADYSGSTASGSFE